MREQIGGRHRNDEAGLLERRGEPVDLPLSFGVVAAERDQIVVVEGEPVGAEGGQLMNGFDRIERRPGGVAERIAGRPTDRPQSEREAVSRCWCRRHRDLPDRLGLRAIPQLREFV
jgi:hypothetical protein